MPKSTKTQATKKNTDYDDEQEIVQPDYSDEEIEARGDIIAELNHAFRQRQQRYTELDDQTYDEWYVANAKAGNGYIPPKLNPEDVRVVTGTTREKVNTLVASLLNYNLEADIESFDEDDMPLKELGETMTDAVRKSRRLEMPDYEVKRPLIYAELVTQGTVFVAERWLEFGIKRKKLNNVAFADILKAEWVNSEDVNKLCDSQLVNSLNVYLGNIREYFLELQPFIGIRRVLSRSEAKSLYGKWARWENVPKQIQKITENAVNANSVPYQNWYMIEVGENMVEEIIYMNKWTNTYQVLLNGVCMLPCGFPLEYMAGEVEYPMAKGDVEPIGRYFAYSRSVPSKNKFSQALLDEMFKALILKTRKSYNPPMANNTGVMLSKRIFYPGTIHQNIDSTKLQQIGINEGVTNSEFNALQFVKQAIDESSVSPVFEGNQTKGQQTAREIVELKNQSMMKLGLTVLGVMNLEKKMAWLRLNNILRNWTQPIDATVEDVKGEIKSGKVFRSESMDTQFDDQTNGKRIIRFTDQALPHPDQIQAEEDLMSKRRNTKVRIIYLNAEELQRVKYNWYIEITPTEKNTGDLRTALFEESLTKAFTMFGPQSINMDEAKKVWASNQKGMIDPDKFFTQTPPQGQMPQQQLGQQAGMPPAPLTQQLQTKQPPAPSLNTLATA